MEDFLASSITGRPLINEENSLEVISAAARLFSAKAQYVRFSTRKVSSTT
jgi:hypothetical protein